MNTLQRGEECGGAEAGASERASRRSFFKGKSGPATVDGCQLARR
ncbi:hypothetical protein PF003_g5714 [Phytophthora fragariae]|nr:hypothetical protein PF003_g5714 [Phytophthora fragariae]